MKKLGLILRYIRYLTLSKTRYNIHSKFVFDFVNNILRDKKDYEDYNKLWEIRNHQSESNDTIETVDFGSGAKGKKYRTKVLSLGKIVRLRSHSQSRLQLLYRISRYYKPKNILEFGTSTGISASYIKSGNPEGKMITMEGCANLASKAHEAFEKLGLKNIEVAEGSFESNLEKVLEKFDTLDFVFFDGNHRMEPTMSYYESCAKLLNENSIFVFDDIHWSQGMESAWNSIKKDDRVSVTIDLFWFGIVFFRKGIEKQDFVIRY